MREMATEQFSLCWDNFHKNMSSGMSSLLEHEDFVDVTLAIDGRYLKAHKMVLSVCSPYFRELFRTNPCQHPIVFMKDVSYTAMYDLLQFMYQGEVQISQEDLTTFIKTAEALQIKGLTDGGNSSADSDQDDINEMPEVELKKSKKPAGSTITTPPAKRQRINNNKTSQQQQQERQKDEEISINPLKTESSIVTDNIIDNSTITTTQNKSEMVQFRLEPYGPDQSITINDDNDETFNDDTLDEKNGDGDVTDDYPILEGGDDEPKAGTSDEMPGEGQGDVQFAFTRTRKIKMILDRYTFLINNKSRRKIFWVCTYYSKTKCNARCVTDIKGNLRKQPLIHNHPPPEITETIIKKSIINFA